MQDATLIERELTRSVIGAFFKASKREVGLLLHFGPSPRFYRQIFRDIRGCATEPASHGGQSVLIRIIRPIRCQSCCSCSSPSRPGMPIAATATSASPP